MSVGRKVPMVVITKPSAVNRQIGAKSLAPGPAQTPAVCDTFTSVDPAKAQDRLKNTGAILSKFGKYQTVRENEAPSYLKRELRSRLKLPA